ncbi:MAG: T9SS type A sorting domain-containing protein [Ignavibacteriales bacterium]|nr:T9SS type A sorting domain-containing protein [Ignavibacteriales bacterium]
MKKLLFALIIFNLCIVAQDFKSQSNPKIYITFLWHMHQPIYYPYESVVETDQNNRYSFSVIDVHNQRTGPYTSWPKSAVEKGITAGFSHFGSQVSFSGSLIENLNVLESNGIINFQNWKSYWNTIKTQNTSLGNPRLDMVAFGYFHPLMGLTDSTDIVKQIQKHKNVFSSNFSGNYSKGVFPPENAFAPDMIPALVAEGIEWVIIDNIHFERACLNYPYNTGGSVIEPNFADQVNSNPNDWLQLNGLWAPTQVSAQWSRQPHYIEYVNPKTGEVSRIIGIPGDRYLGNEDGRGGFGALNYEYVMSQLESYNTDPDHPILIVLPHDGDNHGGGSESYYGTNFQNFVDWLLSNPSRFECTTIQDYLEMFPPNPNDVVHVENGSWVGADAGDPEFKKWLGDSNQSGYSYDRNSWAVVTAGKNWVETAEKQSSSNSNTIEAWKYYLVAQTSCYWYWDGTEIWDSNPTRAINQSINYAQLVVNSSSDNIPPSIFRPQREPYNPGGTEWGTTMTNDLTIWTLVYDLCGLDYVRLKYRVDLDGVNSTNSTDNDTYDGGAEVGNWISIDMDSTTWNSQTDPLPTHKAKMFYAQINDSNNILIDYYVEARDKKGNIAKSIIQHVWIGANMGGAGGNEGVYWIPMQPTINDTIIIYISNAIQGAKLHWGVNNEGSNWTTPNSVYWPPSSVLFNGTGPAVETPFVGPDLENQLSLKIGPFNKPEQNIERVAFVIHYNDDTWDNNNGQDYHISFGDTTASGFVMDGNLDGAAANVANNNGSDLFVAWQNPLLYVATQSAQSQGHDMFILVSDGVDTLLVDAPWAKSGQTSKWDYYLANESTNGWCGWFDSNESQPTTFLQSAADSYLEGTMNISQLFGYNPVKIYLAVGKFQTHDGGNLIIQVPVSKDGNSNINFSEFYEYNFTQTDFKNEAKINPEEFSLLQNYPNPFNPVTIISYVISERTFVEIKVFDVLGREIKTLVNEFKDAGIYKIEFNSSSLSTGVYFYKIIAEKFSQTKKMIILK